MNDRLNRSALQHIIKKIITYLISSPLNQVCDMKIDTFWRITHIHSMSHKIRIITILHKQKFSHIFPKFLQILSHFGRSWYEIRAARTVGEMLDQMFCHFQLLKGGGMLIFPKKNTTKFRVSTSRLCARRKWRPNQGSEERKFIKFVRKAVSNNDQEGERILFSLHEKT